MNKIRNKSRCEVIIVAQLVEPSLPHQRSEVKFNSIQLKRHRCCAWDSNLGPHNGRRSRNHGALAATHFGNFFLKNGPFSASFFFIFVFSIQLTVDKQLNVRYKSLPMTGFELRTSGVRSNCSTN